MIAVEEARQLVLAEVGKPVTERVPLASAGGRYTAEHITAPYDHPLFDCSAVDGYAVGSLEEGDHRIVGSVAAGEFWSERLKPGEAVRIFTGATVPDGAIAVAMQEDVLRIGDQAQVEKPIASGSHIRRKGEQLRTGGRVIDAGIRLGAPAMGLLASVGVEQVAVAALPRVVMVITGNEFATTRPPEVGMIFNSNDVMLTAALARDGYPAVVFRADDDRVALREVLRSAASSAEVVITTGGASVGDHDLLAPVLADLGAQIHFHRVAQKPGKPMLFATLGNARIFGLPGNPRAVMVLYWEYVLPFLRAMQGAAHPGPLCERMPLAHNVEAKGQRTEFRAAKVQHGRATLLADEGSHMLRSLMDANALACLPATKQLLVAGDLVDIHWIT